MHHPSVSGQTEPRSFLARYYYYHIHLLHYFGVGDFEKSYMASRKLIGLYNEYPKKREESIESYASIMTNALRLLSNLNHREEWDSLLIETRNTCRLISVKEVREAFIGNTYHSEINYYVNTGDLPKALEKVAEVESRMEYFSEEARVDIYPLISDLYFILGDYKTSLQWLNRGMDTPSHLKGDSLYYFYNRIRFLILHLELGNRDLLEYAVISTYRHLRKKKSLYKAESALLKFIKNELPGFRNAEDIQRGLGKLHETLKALEEDPFEAGLFKRTFMIPWLESKITGRSLAEIVREKAGTENKE